MLRELWSHYRRERTRLTMLVALGVLSALAEVGTLLALAPLMQATAEGSSRYVGDAGPFSLDVAVSTLALIAGALVVVSLLAQLVFSWWSSTISATLGSQKRREVADAYQSASWEAQQRLTDGQLVALTGGHTQTYAGGLGMFAQFLRAALSIGIFVGAALAISLSSTIVVVVAMGAVFIALRTIRGATRRLSEQRSLTEIEMSQEINSIHHSAREAAAFGVAQGAGRKYREFDTEMRHLFGRSQFLGAITGPLYRAAGLLLLVGLVAYVAQTRALEVAAIAVVALMLYRSLGYGQQLASTAQKLAGVPPFVVRLDEAIASLRADPIVEGSIKVDHVRTVDVECASYSYPDAEVGALTDVSISLSVGEVVGIVGPSGAGKSTLAELLLALRRPTSGTVRFDGVDVRELTHASRTRLTAIVSQSVPLISGTVRDNVRFYRDLDDATVDRAIDRVGLAAMVDSLPDGPDTRLGDHGRGISGGQLQRIGIARALAGGPNLVVLDEPTSALDAAAESVVTDLTGELRSEAAVVVIAHRLTTLRRCDRIVVVDEGRIAATGTLDQLRVQSDFVDQAYRVGTL